MTPNKEREAFEAWARDTAHKHGDSYGVWATNANWMVFRAGTRAARDQQAGQVTEAMVERALIAAFGELVGKDQLVNQRMRLALEATLASSGRSAGVEAGEVEREESVYSLALKSPQGVKLFANAPQAPAEAVGSLPETTNAFDPVSFGRKLASRMYDLRLTVRKAARLIGCSPTTVNRVQRGLAPDVESYCRISSWLLATTPFVPTEAPAEAVGEDAVAAVKARCHSFFPDINHICSYPECDCQPNVERALAAARTTPPTEAPTSAETREHMS